PVSGNCATSPGHCSAVCGSGSADAGSRDVPEGACGATVDVDGRGVDVVDGGGAVEADAGAGAGAAADGDAVERAAAIDGAGDAAVGAARPFSAPAVRGEPPGVPRASTRPPSAGANASRRNSVIVNPVAGSGASARSSPPRIAICQASCTRSGESAAASSRTR